VFKARANGEALRKAVLRIMFTLPSLSTTRQRHKAQLPPPTPSSSIIKQASKQATTTTTVIVATAKQ